MKDTKNSMISDCINLLIMYLRTVYQLLNIKCYRGRQGTPCLPRLSDVYGHAVLVKLDVLDLRIPVIECGDVRSYSVHVNSLS